MSRRKALALFTLVSCLAAAGWLYVTTPGHLVTPPGLSERITFLDRRGLEIRAYAPGETYEWVKLKEVPPDLIKLLLLAEDRHFYEHGGIDFKGALRSLAHNLRSLRVVSGASTIDQQVYREAHHTPRSFFGKIRVMMGALKINQRYTKDEILQHYVNTLPFARQITGVKRASEVLFGKDLELLSLSEFATLAILPRAPGYLTQKSTAALLNQKKNQLLTEMVKDPEQLALEQKIIISFQKDFSGWENFHVVSKLLKRKDLSRFIREGKVSTTLDSYLQKEVSAILRAQLEELKSLNVSHGAVVVVENGTGDVLSYVGSQDILNTEGGHFDALEVKRQPGSALKPFTYALALQSGKTLGDTLPDIPSYYKTGLGQFLPRNYDQTFSGPRLLREALANSLNLPAVALADELGVESVYRFYKNLGLNLNQEASHYGVGLTLGNVEITPLNLAHAYTSFANLGAKNTLRYLMDEDIKLTETELTPEAAYLISDVLSDPIARREEFGEKNPFDLPFEFSVKTGTSTDFRDNWSVGFNQRYTIVVWVGNMDQKGMKKVSGITGAGPVLARVASYLMKQKYLPRLGMPENIERKEICALSGLMPGPHCSHKKTELFVKGTQNQTPCSFHQELTVHDCHEPGDLKKINVARLPDAYQLFIDQRPEWSVDAQVADLCSLQEARAEKSLILGQRKIQINRPLSESVYALDPNLPKNLQRLKLQLNQVENIKKVEWKNNGQTIQGKTLSVDWMMEKGKHHFEAEVYFEDGHSEKTQTINVTVL